MSDSSEQYIVIGGGVAGLSAAIRLAAAGKKVVLLEKNERLGGKLNTWEEEGFTFDTGPHVVTMTFAFMELFEAASKRLGDYIDLVRLDNVCRYHFTDGHVLDCSSDPIASARTLEEKYPGSRKGFERFLQYSAQVYDKTTDTFLKQDVGDAIREGGPLYALRNMRNFLSLKPFESLDKRVCEYFKHEELRQIFRLYALYSGSHPKRCSSIFSTVAHVQWNLGTFYVMGGIYKLAEAMAQLLLELGVTIVIRAEATNIDTQAGKVVGVRASVDGSTIFYPAAGIVCNQDVLTAYRMLGGATTAFKVEPSTSAFVLLLGIEGSYDVLAHHNSFLTGDEWGEFASLFDRNLPFGDPTIGVSCQSVTDPMRAPKGCSNLFVMANVPALSSAFVWNEESIMRYRKTILGKLERMGLPRLTERIVVEQVWTPHDFERRYNSARGAIYGLSSNGFRQAFIRPSQTPKNIKGLVYAGGSTHPGGGMPLCVLSGRIAAEKLMRAN